MRRTSSDALAKLTEKIAASNVRTGTPRARRFEYFTADEARRLLTTSQGHQLHALFELARHTGLRKGELLGLRWEDLGLDRAPVPSAARCSEPAQAASPRCPPRTRASERRIALPSRCLQSLKHHHEKQQRDRETARAD